jgi:hypothetical protein
VPAGCFGVKHRATDRQRFVHDRGKVHNGWPRGHLQTALRALRVQRGVLHYTPSILLCKTSVLRLGRASLRGCTYLWQQRWRSV